MRSLRRFIRDLYREAHYRSEQFKTANMLWDRIQQGDMDDWLDYLIMAIRVRKQTIADNGSHEGDIRKD